jgi:hypothetical protein
MCDLGTLGRGVIIAALTAGMCLGCSAPRLSLDDVIIRGPTTQLVGYVQNAPLSGPNGAAHLPVEFFLDGRAVGSAVPNSRGLAVLPFNPPNDPLTVAVGRATVGGRAIEGASRVFRWTPDRTAIAVDIDGTVVKTDYDELLFAAFDKDSIPLPGARETLQRLAGEFDIVYLTSRPRFLLEKTRRFLDAKGYPRGPVITAPRLRDALRRERYKQRTLHKLCADWPNLLIGVGNSPTDAQAYAANGLLPLVLRGKHQGTLSPRALSFDNWDAIASFFEANHETLATPQLLRSALADQAPQWQRHRESTSPP